MKCRTLIKKPWALSRVLNVNPNICGVIGPGLLNQVPTLGCLGCPKSTAQGVQGGCQGGAHVRELGLPLEAGTKPSWV